MQIDTTAVADSTITGEKRNEVSVSEKLKAYIHHPGSGIRAYYRSGRDRYLCRTGIFGGIYPRNRYPLSERGSVQLGIYIRERVFGSVSDQYIYHDYCVIGHCCAPWDFCSNLSGRIFKTGKPLCEDHPCYGRDTFRYSVYRIWTFWYAVFRNGPSLGNVPAVRRVYHGDHGTSRDHAYLRGGIKIRSGFLQGSQFWPWGRQASYDFYYCTSLCGSWNSCGRYPCHRTCGR